MANEKFKVKFGLAVGDTAATIDATSGDITTAGDLAVNGGDLTTTSTGTATVFNANATTVNIAGAATTVSIGANTGTTTVNNSLVADDISITTVDTTNLEVTNIKAKDGTAAATIADSTGVITVSSQLNVDNLRFDTNTISSTDTNGNITLTPDGTGDVVVSKDLEVQGVLQTDDITNGAGPITITSGSNGNITIEPNGTGDVLLTADSVVVGDLNTNATITTNGTGNLILNTNAGTNSGNITITQGLNGNITVTTSGTGNAAFSFNNGGNITNTNNYVYGAIRNATTQSNGNIWSINQGSNTFPSRGISIDNSNDATRTSVNLLRNYSNTAGNPGRVVFERSRFTGTTATPTTLSSGDTIGALSFSGYTSTGWINDSYTFTPGVINMVTAEAWVSNTNLGTTFQVTNAPTATTITAGANLITTISHNPQTATYRSDAFTFQQGKTGTTNLMTLDSSGNMVVTGDVRVNGNDLQASDGLTNITMTSNTLTAFAGDIRINGNDLQASDGNTNITMTSNTLTAFAGDIKVGGNSIQASDGNINIEMTSNTLTEVKGDLQVTGNEIKDGAGKNHISFDINATSVMKVYENNNGSFMSMEYLSSDSNQDNAQFECYVKRTTGATQNNDKLGSFKFHGHDGTNFVNSGEVTYRAAETFTGSAQGTTASIVTVKTGTTTELSSLSLNSATNTYASDLHAFKDSSLTAATRANFDYTRSYGEFAYTNAAGFGFAAQNTIYTMPLDTTLTNSGSITISGTGTLNLDVAGAYKIIMSLQAAMITNSVGTFQFWLRKNGADVANSKTEVDLLKDQKSVIAMDWLVTSDGNDEFEIVYASGSANYANITFPTIAANSPAGYTSPLAPALIVNVIPVGI